MKKVSKYLSIILIITLVVLIFLFDKSEEVITVEQYTDLYRELPTWSIDEFPNNSHEYNGASYARGWSCLCC